MVLRASDIFTIGSLIYEIITGRPPYDELEEDEVEKRFKRAEFPSTANLDLGKVIRGCWAAELQQCEVLDDVLMYEDRYMYSTFARLARLWRTWVEWWHNAQTTRKMWRRCN